MTNGERRRQAASEVAGELVMPSAGPKSAPRDEADDARMRRMSTFSERAASRRARAVVRLTIDFHADDRSFDLEFWQSQGTMATNPDFSDMLAALCAEGQSSAWRRAMR